MQSKPSQPAQSSNGSAATELKALQKQIAALQEEVVGLRSELNKKLLKNPSDLIAYGVLKAGLAMIVLVFILQLLFSRA